MSHLELEALSLLADEMVDKRQAEEYHRHIGGCALCEQAYDDIVAMSFAMAKAEVVAPPGGYEAFAQGIMSNLPTQDPVSAENTVEIREHRVKQSFVANLNWQQVLGYGAMVAVLAGMFLPQPDLGHTPSMGVSDVGVESSYTEEGSMTTSGEIMVREVESPGVMMEEDVDTVSMATPGVGEVVEEYSPDDLETAWAAMTYSGVAGVSLSEEQSLDVVRLVLDLRAKSGENFWPVVLHLAEEQGELEGSWGKWEDFSFTTRTYDEITPYLSLFPDLDEDSSYLLITSRQ